MSLKNKYHRRWLMRDDLSQLKISFYSHLFTEKLFYSPKTEKKLQSSFNNTKYWINVFNHFQPSLEFEFIYIYSARFTFEYKIFYNFLNYYVWPFPPVNKLFCIKLSSYKNWNYILIQKNGNNDINQFQKISRKKQLRVWV